MLFLLLLLFPSISATIAKVNYKFHCPINKLTTYTIALFERDYLPFMKNDFVNAVTGQIWDRNVKEGTINGFLDGDEFPSNQYDLQFAMTHDCTYSGKRVCERRNLPDVCPIGSKTCHYFVNFALDPNAPEGFCEE